MSSSKHYTVLRNECFRTETNCFFPRVKFLLFVYIVHKTHFPPYTYDDHLLRVCGGQMSCCAFYFYMINVCFPMNCASYIIQYAPAICDFIKTICGKCNIGSKNCDNLDSWDCHRQKWMPNFLTSKKTQQMFRKQQQQQHVQQQ